jgi:hypothetical protein
MVYLQQEKLLKEVRMNQYCTIVLRNIKVFLINQSSKAISHQSTHIHIQTSLLPHNGVPSASTFF